MFSIKDLYNKPVSKEHEFFVFENMKCELECLLELCKDDYQSVEATKEKEEFMAIVKANPELENVKAHLVNRVDSMVFRGWLFNYKGRGYVLSDIGNGHFSYLCTAEETLVGVHYNNFESEY